MDSLSISSTQLSIFVFVSIAFSTTALAVALGAVLCLWGLRGKKREPGESHACGNSTPYAPAYTAYQPGDPKRFQAAGFAPRPNPVLAADRAASTHNWTSQSYGRPDELHMHKSGGTTMGS